MSTESPDKYSTPIKTVCSLDPLTPSSGTQIPTSPDDENIENTDYCSPPHKRKLDTEEPVPAAAVIEEYNRFINSLRAQHKPSHRDISSQRSELKALKAPDQKDAIITIGSYERYAGDDKEVVIISPRGSQTYDNEPKPDPIKTPMLRTPEKKTPGKKKEKPEKKIRIQSKAQNMGLSLKIKTKISLPEVLSLPSLNQLPSDGDELKVGRSCKDRIFPVAFNLATILFHVLHAILLFAYFKLDHKLSIKARHSNIWGLDIAGIGFVCFSTFEIFLSICKKSFKIQPDHIVSLINNLGCCLYPIIEAVSILALWVYPLSKVQLPELNDLMVYMILCFASDMIFFLVYFIRSVSRVDKEPKAAEIKVNP